MHEGKQTAAVNVPIDRIHFDSRLQVRAVKHGDSTRLGTVRSYATKLRSGVELPPITLVRVGDILYCADGWHRTAAHNAAKFTSIEATIVDAASMEEAQWIAAIGNTGHGLKLTRREELEVFKRYVRAGKHRDGRRFKTYREMATDLNGMRGHTTVRNWMERTYPSVFRAMGESNMAFSKGPQDLSTLAQQQRLTATAAAYLKKARNVISGVSDPLARGALVAEAEAILLEIRDGGPWMPEPLTAREDEPF